MKRDEFDKEEYEKDKLKTEIYLNMLGENETLNGTYFAIEAVTRAILNPIFAASVSKDIYPDIANKYNTSVAKVDGAIRTYITKIWKYGNQEELARIFGTGKKPSNSKFIGRVATVIRLEQM